MEREKNIKKNIDFGKSEVLAKDELLERLQEKLDWYTDEASQEEYDAKAVESILYLLQTMCPVDEDIVPDEEAAWKSFECMVEMREESREEIEHMECEKSADGAEKVSTIFPWWKAKGFVAAIILMLVFAICGTMQTEAFKNAGFFQWLKKDENGAQMITSPENLDVQLNKQESQLYYKREEIPQDVLEWMLVWEEILSQDGYEWRLTETEGLDNLGVVESVYGNAENEVIVGKIQYANIVTVNTERYVYVKSYYVEDKKLDIYSREEENGVVYYYICFCADMDMHYVEGKGEIGKIQQLAEKYIDLLKK